jgi:hypothetical protein
MGISACVKSTGTKVAGMTAIVLVSSVDFWSRNVRIVLFKFCSNHHDRLHNILQEVDFSFGDVLYQVE